MGDVRLHRRRHKGVVVFGMVFVVGTVYYLVGDATSRHWRPKDDMRTRSKSSTWLTPAPLPPEVTTVYSETDFINEDGTTPSFWSPHEHWNCTEGTRDECARRTWGPCYPPATQYNWTELMEPENHNVVHYHALPKPPELQRINPHPDLNDYCRPGFIIIGAGKCGTSSLYHYLIGHPRVLPASKKQIHYFKYHSMYNSAWYLAHFPTTTSFISNGALMTGEASPGYLPYPNVAHLVAKRMPGPKIIAIGREPIDRSWSSYNYNYVIPAMEKLRKGQHRGVPRGKSDEFYQQYLFSYEDMIQAELEALTTCLKPGGVAELGARKDWQHKEWARNEFERRSQEGLPPLVDLDKYCYGKTVSRIVPRRQWEQLVDKYPEKIINVPNLHLVQAFVGRSLYTLPLEWWYATHGSSQVSFVCTEELRDQTGEPLNQLGKALGLPAFDFSQVVSKGMYNVGYNKGYDTATTWNSIQNHTGSESDNPTTIDRIPLSDELRKELKDFVKPFNERLFQLTGKRCKW